MSLFSKFSRKRSEQSLPKAEPNLNSSLCMQQQQYGNSRNPNLSAYKVGGSGAMVVSVGKARTGSATLPANKPEHQSQLKDLHTTIQINKDISKSMMEAQSASHQD